MFILDAIVNTYQAAQDHPLVWQALLAAISTSGLFEYAKHKLVLEGKARITFYLSCVSFASVVLHFAILGISFWDHKTLFGYQTVAYIGLLVLVNNFMTSKVVKVLQDAKAQAEATSPSVPVQTASNDVPMGAAVSTR